MIITVISSLFSGILATCITLLVTSIQRNRQEKYNFKLEVFKEIIAYRTDIVAGCKPTGNFQRSLNQIFIAYNDCPVVLKAFESFRKSVMYRSSDKKENEKIIDNLVVLLKEMAKSIKIDYSFSNDDLFTKPVYIGMPNFSGPIIYN